MDRWLARLSNIAVVVVASVFVYAFVWQRLSPSPSRRAAADYQAGDQVPISNLPVTDRTLLLVTKSTCAFCTASMPFYRTLPETLNIIAIAAEATGINQTYLEANDVHVDAVISMADAGLRITATPTLIAVDAKGTVLDAWRGQLSVGDERKVRRVLGLEP